MRKVKFISIVVCLSVIVMSAFPLYAGSGSYGGSKGYSSGSKGYSSGSKGYSSGAESEQQQQNNRDQKKLELDDCMKACKQYTSRTNEQCFDSCISR